MDRYKYCMYLRSLPRVSRRMGGGEAGGGVSEEGSRTVPG